MSAVLSRSLLADLLEKYAGRDDFSLNLRIEKLRSNTNHPSGLREGMQHFRKIGNLGAHTQKTDLEPLEVEVSEMTSDQAQIIPVTREDAEWMLDFLDRVFDYFVVTPEKDRAMLTKWDEKIADAGRKPIPPIGDEQE